MAAQLSAAGVDADLRVHPSAPHDVTGHATPVAALDDLRTWLDGRLGR
ncbi:hypothetical protein [Nonomuraea longispora]|nr:hypothetical protein [Nonomuraea longispora]